MPLILPGNVASATAATTYSITNSCRFNDGDNPKLARTSPDTAPTDADKFTFSCWYKRGIHGGNNQIFDTWTGSADQFQVLVNTDNTLRCGIYNASGHVMNLITTRVLRDSSAWYSIIFSYDSTPSTPNSSSIRLWINGVQETAFSTETYPSQNTNGALAQQNHGQIIGNDNSNSYPVDGYLAEVIGVDGQALVNTDFGEFDEDSPTIWKPKDISGINVGNLGWYCDFKDSSNLGNDVSAVGTDFTETNIAAADQATDTPTNNFAVLNPLNTADTIVYSEGNTHGSMPSPGYRTAISTIGITTGKWYWEAKVTFHAKCDQQYGIAHSDTPER